MRRAVAITAITLAGLYAVLSYKSSPLPRNVTAANAAAPPTTTEPSGAARGAGQAAAAPPPAGDNPPTTGSAAAGNTGSRTVPGSVVSTRYGDVQVAVVLQGSRITDVQALQLPFDRSRSQRISDEAAPILKQEVLDAQGANIDGVSGATYTSEGYAESLQAALGKARG